MIWFINIDKVLVCMTLSCECCRSVSLIRMTITFFSWMRREVSYTEL